jgi:pimeloyl-ACP methyl ester carboxylesterase
MDRKVKIDDPSLIIREVVAITNRKEEQLYGIVTSPIQEQTSKKVIISCYTGVACKAGPGNCYRWIGDRLSAEGYYVVRFDQSGSGDSQGDLPNMSTSEYFQMIQSGRAVPDTVEVIEWVMKTLHPIKIYLLGHCGGCITAAMAAIEKIQVIDGLIFIAIPVLNSQVGAEPMREREARSVSRDYLKRLSDPQSYLRFLRGQTDMTLLKTSFAAYGKSIMKKVMRPFLPTKKRVQLHPLFNQHFWQAFQELMRQKKRILFLMAELDDETLDFNNEFKTKVLDQHPDYAELCTLEYLPQTDHAIMFEESRNTLKKELLVALSTVFE